jgi:hypothetical protein
LFMVLDKHEIENAFRKYSFDLANSNSNKDRKYNTSNAANTSLQIAVDGKFLKGSFDKLVDTEALNLISVFLVQKGLVLAHLGVENKESEMVGVQDLLEQQELIESLKLTGVKVITMDALHCQKKH